jgi:hypothetical protein
MCKRSRLCADGFESLQGGQHLLSKILATGWLSKASMSKVAERTDNLLDLC